jgi:uncharacterized protein (TIGR03435 family)
VAVLSGPAAAAEGPKAGEAAPPLSVKALLNAPEGASAEWDRLRGKVVVVEFWATWCAPCIASIPHLNALADRFRDEDVVFLSLTDEPRATVEPFLSRRPIKGWVALDTDRQAGPAYGVTAIPHTFIVGRTGKVLGDMHPSDLEAEHIERALRGEPLGLVQADHGAAEGAAGTTVPLQRRYSGSFQPGRFPAVAGDHDVLPEPLAQVVVRPALDPGGGSSGGSGENRQTWLNIGAVSAVKQAYSRAHGVPDSRVDVRAPLPEKRLDVAIWAPPGDPRQFRRLVEAGLGGAFGLAARSEEREVDVFLLKAPDAGALKLTPTASTGGSMMSTKRVPGGLVATVINQNPSGLASLLESRLGLPVLDETGLAGGYDFEVTVPDDAREARESLRALGLSLEPARRKLTYLVVETAGKN